jgi:tetratricopeptide (TPR) repeat protein
MNWERKLAEAIAPDPRALLPRALEARNLCRQKRYGQALEVLWQMLRAARDEVSPQREAFVLIHIGKVYRNWIWDAALKFFRDGRELSRQCGFTRGELIAESALGELYYAWGKQDRALAHYRRSLELAEGLEDAGSRRDILMDMIDCYEARGELETCDQLLAEAARLDEALGAPSLADSAGMRHVG